jgi:hypothetical protein
MMNYKDEMYICKHCGELMDGKLILFKDKDGINWIFCKKKIHHMRRRMEMITGVGKIITVRDGKFKKEWPSYT